MPEVAVNGGSLWFHTAADLPSVVTPGILTRLAEGFLGSVDAILAQPAGRSCRQLGGASIRWPPRPASPTAAPR